MKSFGIPFCWITIILLLGACKPEASNAHLPNRDLDAITIATGDLVDASIVNDRKFPTGQELTDQLRLMHENEVHGLGGTERFRVEVKPENIGKTAGFSIVFFYEEKGVQKTLRMWIDPAFRKEHL